MRFSPRTLAAVAGSLWLLVGVALLQLGFRLLMQEEMLFWTPVSLLVGSAKGWFLLRKSARREVARLNSAGPSLSITQLYSPRYYLLLASMMALGLSFSLFGLSSSIRGVIDLAIGTALLMGSLVYFNATTCGSSSPS